MKISHVVEAIDANSIRINDHADLEAHEDRLSYEEVYCSVRRGEIIEEYPTDTPYPSCLVYGQTTRGEPIHSVWAYNPNNRWAVLITVYRPDPNRWINWTERRNE
jgi:hypothetical protein